MKSLKDLCLINEAKNARVFPEDYTNMKSEADLVNCIIDTLVECDMIDSIAQSVAGSLDPHVFMDKKFLNEFSKALNTAVMEVYEAEYA